MQQVYQIYNARQVQQQVADCRLELQNLISSGSGIVSCLLFTKSNNSIEVTVSQSVKLIKLRTKMNYL